MQPECSCYVYPVRVHEPKFAQGVALYIIWRQSPEGERATGAAGTLSSVLGAWAAIQSDYLRDELTLQNGAMVMHRRPAARG